MKRPTDLRRWAEAIKTMKTISLSCCLLFIVSCKVPLDKSKINYLEEEYKTPICSGTLKKELLDQIKITNEEFVEGIQCARGDYDGNGHSDYALFSNIQNIRGTISRESGFLIVLYQNGKIINSYVIRDTDVILLVTYKAGREKGVFGEPSTKIDGLIEWGEGGTTKLFLLDKEKNIFVRSEYASERE